MGPVMADGGSVKSSRWSNPSRKVRVVGKIRDFTDKEYESLTQDSKPWITVKKTQEDGSSEKCTVFLETQSFSRKNGYKLDYCYDQDQDIGKIYLREIKPLILEVFDGQNASVIALGARGSGKTSYIQGSQEKPGLALMAMSEILSKASELGKLVSISLYELTNDQVYDLLNPKHPVVQVLEDAQGKINLKGLSQVTVVSISEFYNIYFRQGGSYGTQKMPRDESRSHKGLMVHVSSKDDTLKMKKANKINFVDLAGYEDPKKNNRNGITPAESNRVNKSLYALLNVISAINSNDIRVPYRASKLTRILQDSLGGTSRVLLLTCLNPTFCLDSLCSISLVSRSCQSAKQILVDSTNRVQSSAKTKVLSSLKSSKAISASLSEKKQIGRSQFNSTKHASCVMKGRKLFDEEKLDNPKQLGCQSEDASAQKSEILSDLPLVDSPFSLEEALQDKSVSNKGAMKPTEDVDFEGIGSQSTSKLQNILLSGAPKDEVAALMKMDVSPPDVIHNMEAMPAIIDNDPKKENASPPLSERIKEISNNLKSLCASTPLTIKMSDNVQSYGTDIVEPKTPSMEHNNAIYCSPRSTFSNRSSRVKQSLVQEYLTFLNSANKDELKSIKGIGEKRAAYILQLREKSPEHFKNLDDLQDIGLSAKQIKGMMKDVAGEIFN